MSLDDFDEVPEAKSSRSTSAVLRPRLAASRATPAPVIPPPMTSTSNCSEDSAAKAVSRRNRPALDSLERARDGMGKRLPQVGRDTAIDPCPISTMIVEEQLLVISCRV